MEPKPRPGALWNTLFFGFLFAALSTWLSPRLIAWYFNPPVNIGIDCRNAVEWAMRKLQIAQMGSFVLGIAVGGLFWMSRYRRWKKQVIAEPTLGARTPIDPKF